MSEEPVRINRLHSVWPKSVRSITRVFPGQPGGWIEIEAEEGNRYQTELLHKADVDHDELVRTLVDATGLVPREFPK